MGSFQEGYKTGAAVGSPYEGLLDAVNSKFKEREARRLKDSDEEKALTRELIKLTAMEKVKDKYAKEQQEQKSLLEGKIQETTETSEGTFEGTGTSFDALGKTKRYKSIKQETPVYLVDPVSGETRQVATTPKGAKTVRGQAPTTEKIQMGTYLNSMEESIDAMEEKLKDPNIMLRGLLNPLGEREFKAILASFDKEAAIAAGGKQLTKTELDLIRSTRPTIWDIKSPDAIARKIKKLRVIVKDAKSRLGAGSGVSGQANEEDTEYQSYLKSIGQ